MLPQKLLRVISHKVTPKTVPECPCLSAAPADATATQLLLVILNHHAPQLAAFAHWSPERDSCTLVGLYNALGSTVWPGNEPVYCRDAERDARTPRGACVAEMAVGPEAVRCRGYGMAKEEATVMAIVHGFLVLLQPEVMTSRRLPKPIRNHLAALGLDPVDMYRPPRPVPVPKAVRAIDDDDGEITDPTVHFITRGTLLYHFPKEYALIQKHHPTLISSACPTFSPLLAAIKLSHVPHLSFHHFNDHWVRAKLTTPLGTYHGDSDNPLEARAFAQLHLALRATRGDEPSGEDAAAGLEDGEIKGAKEDESKEPVTTEMTTAKRLTGVWVPAAMIPGHSSAASSKDTTSTAPEKKVKVPNWIEKLLHQQRSSAATDLSSSSRISKSAATPTPPPPPPPRARSTDRRPSSPTKRDRDSYRPRSRSRSPAKRPVERRARSRSRSPHASRASRTSRGRRTSRSRSRSPAPPRDRSKDRCSRRHRTASPRASAAAAAPAHASPVLPLNKRINAAAAGEGIASRLSRERRDIEVEALVAAMAGERPPVKVEADKRTSVVVGVSKEGGKREEVAGAVSKTASAAPALTAPPPMTPRAAVDSGAEAGAKAQSQAASGLQMSEATLIQQLLERVAALEASKQQPAPPPKPQPRSPWSQAQQQLSMFALSQPAPVMRPATHLRALRPPPPQPLPPAKPGSTMTSNNVQQTQPQPQQQAASSHRRSESLVSFSSTFLISGQPSSNSTSTSSPNSNTSPTPAPTSISMTAEPSGQSIARSPTSLPSKPRFTIRPTLFNLQSPSTLLPSPVSPFTPHVPNDYQPHPHQYQEDYNDEDMSGVEDYNERATATNPNSGSTPSSYEAYMYHYHTHPAPGLHFAPHSHQYQHHDPWYPPTHAYGQARPSSASCSYAHGPSSSAMDVGDSIPSPPPTSAASPPTSTSTSTSTAAASPPTSTSPPATTPPTTNNPATLVLLKRLTLLSPTHLPPALTAQLAAHPLFDIWVENPESALTLALWGQAQHLYNVEEVLDVSPEGDKWIGKVRVKDSEGENGWRVIVEARARKREDVVRVVTARAVLAVAEMGGASEEGQVGGHEEPPKDVLAAVAGEAAARVQAGTAATVEGGGAGGMPRASEASVSPMDSA